MKKLLVISFFLLLGILIFACNTTTETASMPPTATSIPMYLQDVWLCQDNAINVQDYSTEAQDNLTCTVTIEYTETDVILRSSGIPNHSFESTIGCCASSQNSIWYIPIFPKDASASDITMAPELGPIAVTVSGVAIYGPEEGPGGDAVALDHGYFTEDRQPIELGICGGHSGPGGQYHYHYDSNCMHWHPDTSSKSVEGWLNSYTSDTKKHSSIIGFAFDGYPIYGSYGWDENKNIKEITSSYKLKDGANGYNGIDDYEYVEGLGDLDKCNGRFSSTPEAPEGIYHYHATLTNGNGKLGFPYFLLCYHGIPNKMNFSTGQGGGPPPMRGPRPEMGGRPPPERDQIPPNNNR